MADSEYVVLLPDGGPPTTAATTPAAARWTRWRRQAQHYLESKEKHYLILALVSLDVLAILTEILLSLITCDTGTEDLPWVEPVENVIKICGLVFSCLFLIELIASVWAFGWSFFSAWFHCFDAFVILISFVVDVLAHGVIEEIASLVIVLRLWRMVKIVEELSVGASEQMEELEAQVEKLEQEKDDLVARVRELEQGS
ncbi:ion transporter [Grosmannia clavigera kw1407]|uniref:Voltage-gated hydrogen channel 1 n=1 Tax=Grosmannia clavigera (strain kw1407 / UAMH 11150) TaxID=655863 RepID=F0XCX7_GROCL|nr:ion transporter [Grosmannia clavigera kw1407]EFX03831.1 ion transporter [Grosmannia clavigera kw1407]